MLGNNVLIVMQMTLSWEEACWCQIFTRFSCSVSLASSSFWTGPNTSSHAEAWRGKIVLRNTMKPLQHAFREFLPDARIRDIISFLTCFIFLWLYFSSPQSFHRLFKERLRRSCLSVLDRDRPNSGNNARSPRIVS